MSFSEFEIASINKSTLAYAKKHGPPPHLAKELRWEWDIEGQSVILYEVRPHWQDSSELIRSGCIKTTYVKSKNEWRIFWMRADLKWHRYEPMPEVSSFDQFLEILEEDKHCCFFG